MATTACNEEIGFCKLLSEKVNDMAIIQKFEKGRAPLAMLVFARVVVDEIILPKNGTSLMD